MTNQPVTCCECNVQFFDLQYAKDIHLYLEHSLTIIKKQVTLRDTHK